MILDTIEDLTTILIVVMSLGYALWWVGTGGGRR